MNESNIINEESQYNKMILRRNNLNACIVDKMKKQKSHH